MNTEIRSGDVSFTAKRSRPTLTSENRCFRPSTEKLTYEFYSRGLLYLYKSDEIGGKRDGVPVACYK